MNTASLFYFFSISRPVTLETPISISINSFDNEESGIEQATRNYEFDSYLYSLSEEFGNLASLKVLDYLINNEFTSVPASFGTQPLFLGSAVSISASSIPM